MAAPTQQKLRLRDRRRRLAWVKVAAGTAVVALSLVLVFYVSHLPSLTVVSVDISGTDLVSADAVRAIVSRDLAGSYAYLVPRSNALVVPVSTIRSDLEKAFAPIANVSVSTKHFTALEVAVAERQAAALWCSGVPAGEIANDDNATSTPSAGGGGCYLMDGGGYVFATSTGAEQLPRFYGMLSGEPVGKDYLDGFGSLDAELTNIGKAIGHTPEEVLVDNGGTDVSVAFAEGGVLRFVRTTDPQTTLENIASVFASQSFKDHPEFDYADFRFGDKVYVKFKQ